MMTKQHHPTSSPSGPTPHGSASPHVCPWWLGPLLASPVRRLFESPERMLGPFVRPGMTVVEPGCGMGFFTIPLARMVGPEGAVIALDLQPKMLDGLQRRARRAGVAERIRPVLATADDCGLQAFAGRADLAVVIHMLHEVPDQEALLRQLYAALRPGGVLVVTEPKGHVPDADFDRSLATARAVGFEAAAAQVAARGPSAVIQRPSE